MNTSSYWLQIVVAAPAHSAIAGPLTYRSEFSLTLGTLVRVPLGKREVLGVVWGNATNSGDLPETRTREIGGMLPGLPPLPDTWRQLVSFTSAYYQRSLGEVALAALPPQLREMTGVQLTRRLKRSVTDTSYAQDTTDSIALSAQQIDARALFDAETLEKCRPALLFGATGSGKTEVYLRAAASVLESDPDAQVLVMVPEINLTPQLQARFQARFAHLGTERVVALHSGLTPAQRLKSWLAALSGNARLVLGTRMAVLGPMPHLRLIVVDEEHDPSYKQQEGARYSARDLAVYRGKIQTEALRAAGVTGAAAVCRVMLGSATPSLESWQATLNGRYQLLTMDERIGIAPTLGTVVSSLPPEGAADALLDERSLSKLKWRCRRGLLENDLLIEQFFRRYEVTLSVRQAKGLSDLMELSDNDLMDLLLRRKEPGQLSDTTAQTSASTLEALEVLSLLRPAVTPS